MKATDYVVLSVGSKEIAFTAKSDRAKQRTPETVHFTDRAAALEYMRASEAEGYRFLNARNLDETRPLVKYGYFIKGPNDALIPRKQEWGPLDVDYEAGDRIPDGNILSVLIGTPAKSHGVDLMIVLDISEKREVSSEARPEAFRSDDTPDDARVTRHALRYFLATLALVIFVGPLSAVAFFVGALVGGYRGAMACGFIGLCIAGYPGFFAFSAIYPKGRVHELRAPVLAAGSFYFCVPALMITGLIRHHLEELFQHTDALGQSVEWLLVILISGAVTAIFALVFMTYMDSKHHYSKL